MSAVSIARVKPGNTIGTTADTITLKTPVNQIRVKNTHATQVLYVKVFLNADSEANVVTAIAAATPITATSDFVIAIAAAESRIVMKSKVARYAGMNILGSGAATTFNVEGTPWTEGV